MASRGFGRKGIWVAGYEERYRQWSMYAFDTTEKPVVGKRSREWTAVGQTELHCVQEMAWCLYLNHLRNESLGLRAEGPVSVSGGARSEGDGPSISRPAQAPDTLGAIPVDEHPA